LLAVFFLTTLTACHLLGRDVQQPDPAKLARARGFQWVRDSSEHFLMHIERGSALEHRRDLMKVRLEEARRRVLTRMGEAEYPLPIHIFVVGARARMRPLVGRSTNAIAFHRSHIIAMVVTESWGAAAEHEIFHVLAMNLWGVGPTWLNEGMGVYMDGQWLGNDLHAVAKYLLDRNVLIPLNKLKEDFRDADELVSYPQAGSFARYIFERHGVAAVKALWREDTVAFQALSGKTLAEVDPAWREFLLSVNAQKVTYPEFEAKQKRAKPRDTVSSQVAKPVRAGVGGSRAGRAKSLPVAWSGATKMAFASRILLA
jgi:hypothetical protein